MTIDPKITLRTLLTTEWAIGLTPTIAADKQDTRIPYPIIIVSMDKTVETTIGFSNTLATENRRRTATYALTIHSVSKLHREQLVNEATRIIEKKRLTPGGNLEITDVGDWTVLDDERTSPKTYVSRINLGIAYYA